MRDALHTLGEASAIALFVIGLLAVLCTVLP